jgi:Zn-dependent protease with chaperone function
MTEVDFDFARYVALRRGQIEQRARDGAAYAFAGELKARRMLNTARPVTIAIEATGRRWKSSARDRLLGDATLVTDQSYSALYKAGRRSAMALGMPCPPIYAVPDTSEMDARVLGTVAEPCLFIAQRYAEALDEAELGALIGHQLGHVQNNHILYATALYYLRHDAAFFVRWTVQPAILALQAWSRRAEISCDRAALLCVRDLDAALAFVVKTGTGKLDADVSSFLAEVESTEVGRFADLFRSHPLVPTRVKALQMFAGSALYQKLSGVEKPKGRSIEDVDNDVSEMLNLF